MISNKIRETRRGRLFKMSKNIQRLYKEGKCTECSVVVTRMDFAKILGKFTKVKIQYESSSSPKAKKSTQQVSSPNTRLKSNENGMVLLHRNAYNQHPAKEPSNAKKAPNQRSINHVLKGNRIIESSTLRQVNNILKENNRLKKTPIVKDLNYNKVLVNSNLKNYGIIFVNPNKNNKNDLQSKFSLTELLPFINKELLPSDEWCIDYFPKDNEPKDDKVYDRIAAELEDLMYSEKPALKSDAKPESTETKTDEFPSIMDILNDSTTDNAHKTCNSSNPTDFKANLESSDVEAMLLGKSDESTKEPVPMDVDNTDMSNLIADVAQLNPAESVNETENIDNPHSPSILVETLEKSNQEPLPSDQKGESASEPNTEVMELDVRKDKPPISDSKEKENCNSSIPNIGTVTHVVFRKSANGNCLKSVTCPKSLKYSVELQGKAVEFLGAPKFISSLEDLEVLLQIVDESELDSLYVLH